MKKLVIIAALASLLLPSFSSAATGVPIGGLVTTIQLCNTGILAYLKTPKPPFIQPVMWFWGELPFLHYIPPHPGQYILGVAAPVPAPCFLGYIPEGYGLPIEFHGSSF